MTRRARSRALSVALRFVPATLERASACRAMLRFTLTALGDGARARRPFPSARQNDRGGGMADLVRRQLERAAAQGDPAARAGWLRAVIRGGGCYLLCQEHPGLGCTRCHGTGNRQRHLAELLAYCGDEAAREVVGDPWAKFFEDWLRGLKRWEDVPYLMAARAAWAAVPEPGQWVSPAMLPSWVIAAAVKEIGEEPVRQAIRKALCAWAWDELHA